MTKISNLNVTEFRNIFSVKNFKYQMSLFHFFSILLKLSLLLSFSTNLIKKNMKKKHNIFDFMNNTNCGTKKNCFLFSDSALDILKSKITKTI